MYTSCEKSVVSFLWFCQKTFRANQNTFTPIWITYTLIVFNIDVDQDRFLSPKLISCSKHLWTVYLDFFFLLSFSKGFFTELWKHQKYFLTLSTVKSNNNHNGSEVCLVLPSDHISANHHFIWWYELKKAGRNLTLIY